MAVSMSRRSKVATRKARTVRAMRSRRELSIPRAAIKFPIMVPDTIEESSYRIKSNCCKNLKVKKVGKKERMVILLAKSMQLSY